MTKGHEPEALGLSGVLEQLTYIQSINWKASVPSKYKPIQSVAVGEGMPLQVAVRDNLTSTFSIADARELFASGAFLSMLACTPPYAVTRNGLRQGQAWLDGL